MRFTLRGARLVDATTDLTFGDMTIDDGILEALTEGLRDVENDVRPSTSMA